MGAKISEGVPQSRAGVCGGSQSCNGHLVIWRCFCGLLVGNVRAANGFMAYLNNSDLG